jgi:dihydrolipoamide dehydrogenase
MYDIAIIGAGAAGIACAKEAIRYKLKTLLIDYSKDTFGGVCINKGCIPTKFYLNSAQKNKDWGIVTEDTKLIIEKIKRPTIDYLKKIGVDIVLGQATFIDKFTLKVNDKDISARNIIIASGSRPKNIFTHEKAVFAEELFGYPNIAKNFLIIGAGFIGVEFASLLNRFDKNVTLIEKEDNILPNFNNQLAGRLRIILEKRGIKINTGQDAANIPNFDNFDKIILSVGRKPNIESLKIKDIGIECDKNGWIKTNNSLRTNVKNIYACGDVTGKKLLAYVAQYQAGVCLANIAGKKQTEDYSILPECVFSIPQIAQVGINEDQAKSKNLKYKILRSNFLKFSSAYVYGDTDGFMQVVVGQKDTIIGASVISDFAAELINIFSLALKHKITASKLKKSFFIHPTLSEIIPLSLSES